MKLITLFLLISISSVGQIVKYNDLLGRDSITIMHGDNDSMCALTLYPIVKHNNWKVYACMFGAGLAYGQAEKITWHDPNSRSTFWNPYASDHKYFMNLNGYHLMRGLQDGCVVGAIVLSVNDFKGKNKGLQILKKVALCSVSFYAGQMITYKIIE